VLLRRFPRFLEVLQRCHDNNKIIQEYIDPFEKVLVNMLEVLEL